ncbi:MAG: acyl-CoA carboxylase subunit beta [Balneolaceae bacterium]
MANKNWFTKWVDTLKSEEEKIRKGGGPAQIEKQHKKGKMTARERIATLIDKESDFHELGLWAGYGMYEEEGGCPAGGVITGVGFVSDRRCMIIANDATVKAGAWFPITAKKNLRAQEIALENHLPVIYLVDSAGVYLPLQDEIFPDKEHFGRIFRNNAVFSAKGIPQIAAIMGSCVAGGAYLPVMCDESIMVEGSGTLFLAGSYLVRAAIGEDVENETLGGASAHSKISGVVDYRSESDADCLAKIRKLVDTLGPFKRAGFTRQKPEKPEIGMQRLESLLPEDRNRPYDMYELIKGLIDRHSFTEYKAEYGQTLITGYARLDGWSIGIVANQRKIVKNSLGEMQIGGVIYSDSADKAARFIMNCNQKRIPILFLQDVTGFMIGKRSEHGGIIKDGAKMVNAVANSTVPKITVIVGNSYGAGNYAMCGRAYDPRFIYAWPTARIAVMGGNQAAEVLARIRLSSLKAKNNEISDEEKSGIEDEIRKRYEQQTDVRYAAARLWIDGIIQPSETRSRISEAIHCADLNPDIPEFKTGVFQV